MGWTVFMYIRARCRQGTPIRPVPNQIAQASYSLPVHSRRIKETLLHLPACPADASDKLLSYDVHLPACCVDVVCGPISKRTTLTTYMCPHSNCSKNPPVPVCRWHTSSLFSRSILIDFHERTQHTYTPTNAESLDNTLQSESHNVGLTDRKAGMSGCRGCWKRIGGGEGNGHLVLLGGVEAVLQVHHVGVPHQLHDLQLPVLEPLVLQHLLDGHLRRTMLANCRDCLPDAKESARHPRWPEDPKAPR